MRAHLNAHADRHANARARARTRSWAPIRVLALATVIGGGSLAACSYSPDFANDQLQCSAMRTCPKGYSCATDNKCWKVGATPGGAGGTDGGGVTDAGSDPRTGFVGKWIFTGGTLDATCTDGSALHRAVTGDFIMMNLGVISTNLQAQYYCQTGWTMRLSAGNTSAVAPTPQSCTERTTDTTSTPPVVTTYTWSVVDFSFMPTGNSNGGQTATATSSGHFMGPFTATDGTSGTCNVTFTGPLSRG